MKLYSIIVIYNHNKDILSSVIESLINQVNKIIIVNNNLNEYEYKKKTSIIKVLNLYDNKGIAYAQNIGINIAINEGADFILTSDQDTIYPDNFVKEMLDFYDKYKNHYKIGAISPLFRDLNSKRKIEPVLILKNKKIKKVYDVNSLNECAIVSHVISSGMIIPASVLKEIGLMKEELFIDWVDTEWCWRARESGYEILQNTRVIINHHHGDNSIKFAKFTLINHNDRRKYYRFRNGLYLLLYGKYDLYIKYYIFISLLKMIFLHYLYRRNINNFFKIIIKSIIDSSNKKMGQVKI